MLFCRLKFFTIVRRAVYEHFRMPMEQVCAKLIPEAEKDLKDDHIRNLFFGNYMEPDADPKIYDEVKTFMRSNGFLCVFLIFATVWYKFPVTGERLKPFDREDGLLSGRI